MKYFIFIIIVLTLPLSSLGDNLPPHSGAKMGNEDLWEIWGGQLELHFNTDNFRDFNLTVNAGQASVSDGKHLIPIREQSNLYIWAPKGAFDGYANGELATIGQMNLTASGHTIDLSNFSIRPSRSNSLTLEVVNQAGQVIFNLTHIHSKVNLNEGSLTLKNMDIKLSQSAAMSLNRPELAGFNLGVAYMTSQLQLPPEVDASQLMRGSCSASNAQWHDGVNCLTDVSLINMSSIQQVNSIGNMIAVAPSATLSNIGTADVPWYEKFTTSANGTYPAPYNADHHPFLIWNMYRLVDGRLEQLGASGIKHAFFTVNVGCTCSGGSILWAENSPVNNGVCTDTYGVGNNNSPSAVGIREEVDANLGTWEQCGSIFAPNGTAPGPCSAENFSIPFSTLERRLYVDNADFETPGAEYYLEGWYVIRDDINIFNSMGFRKVTPSGSGTSWTFNLDGGYQSGPVSDLWVDPNSPGPMATSELIDNSLGHMRVISKAEDLGGGNYRYTYAVMNYDFSTGTKAFSVPSSTAPSVTAFDDPDYDSNNDWTFSSGNSTLTWEPPTVDDFQPWGTLFIYEIEIDQAPVNSQATVIDNDDNSYQVNIIGPTSNNDLIFADDFE